MGVGANDVESFRFPFDAIDLDDHLEDVLGLFGGGAARLEEVAAQMAHATGPLPSMDVADMIVSRVPIDQQLARGAAQELLRRLARTGRAVAIEHQSVADEGPDEAAPAPALGLDTKRGLVGQDVGGLCDSLFESHDQRFQEPGGPVKEVGQCRARHRDSKTGQLFGLAVER